MSSAVSLPVLHPRFERPEHYQPAIHRYSLLPFRFIRLDGSRYVLTNFASEHIVLERATLERFVRHALLPQDEAYDELKSRHFLLDEESSVAIDLLAAKYRTKQAILANSTSLFIFVVTLRCDHSCQYCQVSRQSADKTAFDMSAENADRAVDFMFKTPSPTIKVEFQGGESLLNFELIRHIVRRVEERNQVSKKAVAYVIATNLYNLTDEHLAFCKAHGVYLSTSLDGPRDLHNKNRSHPNRDSYEHTIAAIRRAREALGIDRVAALMTTTKASLPRVRDIIDEYVTQGFYSVFLRAVSPYGFAVRGGFDRDYQSADWLKFYFEGLDHILALNRRGIPFQEEYAGIILRKILTPFGTGYVDLQSPAGIGLSVLVFNYDGDVYASDESRMLAEMGDRKFRLGSLATDSYEAIMTSDALLGPIRESMAEAVPMCADCGLQPYCGSDPVRHHAVQGDVVGFKPTSGFCQRNMGVIKGILRRLEDDPYAARVFRSWVKPR